MTCDKTPQCPEPCGPCPESWPVPAGSEVDTSKWEGAEEWMPLAWELCANECGEESCMSLVWEGGPIPEPWGERWLKYEDQAKEMIALVRKHVPSLSSALTEAQIEKVWRLGFRAAIGAEVLNADEEWGYKGANVLEACAASPAATQPQQAQADKGQS